MPRGSEWIRTAGTSCDKDHTDAMISRNRFGGTGPCKLSVSSLHISGHKCRFFVFIGIVKVPAFCDKDTQLQVPIARATVLEICEPKYVENALLIIKTNALPLTALFVLQDRG